ncbi:uncharacterized protein LOC134233029 [Saccostrea cucullata]|uniref:uncharacterized protein LOC134233029 n=1 Tax=Saccostrea cuccullata TaxID=36930 RepID=UPI002ED22932
MWSKMNLSQRQLELFVSLFLLLISCVMSTINISDFNKITEIQSIVSQSRQVSPKYRFRVNKVDSCPSANNTWYEAGVRLNCSHDVHNRLQYLCIPNQEKTTLLEFCYDKIMGLYEKGKCLHLSTSGFVDQEDCSMFFEGCPKIPYFSSNIFKFLKCLDINRDLRCFVADPDCHFRNNHSLPKNCSVMSGSCNSTTIVPKPEPKADNWNIGKIMILLMSIIAIPPIMIWCMAKSIKNKS